MFKVWIDEDANTAMHFFLLVEIKFVMMVHAKNNLFGIAVTTENKIGLKPG